MLVRRRAAAPHASWSAQKTASRGGAIVDTARMPVQLERPRAHAHVALVTLARPEKGNSLDPGMLCDLAAAWRELAADAAVRAIVLTGAGERVFCSGMDMKTHDSRRAGARARRAHRSARFRGPAERRHRAARGLRPRQAAGLRDQRPRSRRRARSDARERTALRGAARDLRARGGGARPLPDRQRHRAAAAPDRLGARAGPVADRATDRCRAGAAHRPAERRRAAR